MQINVKIDEKDMTELERLHYLSEAKANLLSRITSDETKYNASSYNKLMDDYCKTFKQYSLYKEEMDVKYRPKEYIDTAKSWTANFVTRELVYEVE